MNTTFCRLPSMDISNRYLQLQEFDDAGDKRDTDPLKQNTVISELFREFPFYKSWTNMSFEKSAN